MLLDAQAEMWLTGENGGVFGADRLVPDDDASVRPRYQGFGLERRNNAIEVTRIGPLDEEAG